ncbi:MAG: segregation/condensation protein A [Longimicrobiales bacterium]|nr:segregation/condensation protein A [Longimicrobiales bacterium]
MSAARAGSPIETGGEFLLVDVERFQGPLDLLLHLIRQQDIDIFDIPIARITRQFMKAIEGIRADDLDNAGEFLEMASTLVTIKARMLLPRPESEEDEDPRAELVRRLLEYEQIREIATRLSWSEAERSRQFGKGYVEPRSQPDMDDVPLETTWEEVWEAALEVREPVPAREREHRVTTRTVAMEEKAELILNTLRHVSRVEFSRLVRPWREPMHGVMTFLAGLELGRRHLVALRQVRPFSELWLYRGREKADEMSALESPPGVDAGGGGDGGNDDSVGSDTVESDGSDDRLGSSEIHERESEEVQ